MGGALYRNASAGWQGEVQVCLWISTHLPRVGQDARGAILLPVNIAISIHLPRVGQDLADRLDVLLDQRISIHLPRVGQDVRKELLRRAA